jgi:hypothetical protein
MVTFRINQCIKRGLFFFYFFFSHLEHRASVKHFVSLQFLNLRQSVGLLGRGINPSQGLYLNTEQHKQNKWTQTSMPWATLHEDRYEMQLIAFNNCPTSSHTGVVCGVECKVQCECWISEGCRRKRPRRSSGQSDQHTMEGLKRNT